MAESLQVLEDLEAASLQPANDKATMTSENFSASDLRFQTALVSSTIEHSYEYCEEKRKKLEDLQDNLLIWAKSQFGFYETKKKLFDEQLEKTNRYVLEEHEKLRKIKDEQDKEAAGLAFGWDDLTAKLNKFSEDQSKLLEKTKVTDALQSKQIADIEATLKSLSKWQSELDLQSKDITDQDKDLKAGQKRLFEECNAASIKEQKLSETQTKLESLEKKLHVEQEDLKIKLKKLSTDRNILHASQKMLDEAVAALQANQITFENTMNKEKEILEQKYRIKEGKVDIEKEALKKKYRNGEKMMQAEKEKMEKKIRNKNKEIEFLTKKFDAPKSFQGKILIYRHPRDNSKYVCPLCSPRHHVALEYNDLGDHINERHGRFVSQEYQSTRRPFM